MSPPSLVGCFSYLASVHTLHIQQYPRINYGVEVLRSDRFLAGDGPLVAAFLTALGHPTSLTSNQVADDPAGREVLTRLNRWGITPTPSSVAVESTRVNIVICDTDGNRTWYSGLRGIAAELASLDLGPLVSAPVIYLDCYEALGEAPRLVLGAALDAGAEIVLNLGGSSPPQWLTTTIGERRIAVVQTNADNEDLSSARRGLDILTRLGIAELVIVTAGRQGALAQAGTGPMVTAPAVSVDVQQVQGAGAAFSAALIHSRDNGESLPEQLRFACAAGSLWCSHRPDDPLPTAAEITSLMRQ